MTENDTLGVWIKGEENQLVFTGKHPVECSRFVENYPDKSIPVDAFFIASLPRFRVEVGEGIDAKIVAAYESEEHAILFARDYLEANDHLLDGREVNVTG